MSVHSARPCMSAAATARWKRAQLKPPVREFNPAKYRRVKNLVKTHNASLFLNITSQTDDSQKVSKLKNLEEISSQLVFLRKRHDNSRATNIVKELKIHAHGNMVTQIAKMGTRIGNKLKTIADSAENKQCVLDTYHKSIEDEAFTSKVYEHMIERMKQEKIELDRKTYDLNWELRSKDLVLSEELSKKRRQREETIHTKDALYSLEGFIQCESRETRERVDGISRDMAKKLENSEKREERQKKHSEIAEKVANDGKTKSAMETKGKLLLLKLLHSLVQNRLKTLKGWHSKDQEVYSRARAKGGFTCISGLVQKFLTREQDYNDIVKSVIAAKDKVDLYIHKNAEITRKIGQLELGTKGTSNRLQKGLGATMRDITTEKDRETRLRTTHSNIKNWTHKVVLKLNPFLQEHIEIPLNTSLPDIVKTLARTVSSILRARPVPSAGSRPADFNAILNTIPHSTRMHLKRASWQDSASEEGELSVLKDLASIEEPPL